MVFLFRNVVCRHSVATTQFTFTSHCIAHFCVSFSCSRRAMQSHIRKQQILFHRQFEDKQEFRKRNKQIVHILYGYSTYIFEILFASVFIPFYTVYEYHVSCLCSSSIFFSFLLSVFLWQKSAKRRCR